jgi:hypothetical protein
MGADSGADLGAGLGASLGPSLQPSLRAGLRPSFKAGLRAGLAIDLLACITTRCRMTRVNARAFELILIVIKNAYLGCILGRV